MRLLRRRSAGTTAPSPWVRPSPDVFVSEDRERAVPACEPLRARGTQRLLRELRRLGSGVGVVGGIGADLVAGPEAEADDLVRVRLGLDGVGAWRARRSLARRTCWWRGRSRARRAARGSPCRSTSRRTPRARQRSTAGRAGTAQQHRCRSWRDRDPRQTAWSSACRRARRGCAHARRDVRACQSSRW